jgi:hypothetical protein
MSEINNQKDSSKGIKVARNSTLPADTYNVISKAPSNSVEESRYKAINTLREKERLLATKSTHLEVEIWMASLTDLLKRFLPLDSAIIAKLDEPPFKAKGKAPALEHRKEKFRVFIRETIEHVESFGVYIPPVTDLRKNWVSGFSNGQVNSGIGLALGIVAGVAVWGTNVQDAKEYTKEILEKAEEINALKQQLTEYVDRNNHLREDSLCYVLTISSLQDSVARLNNRIKGQ